ncbi:MAG: hypothetical protein ACPGEG_06210 [Salibacteraceae bacterium]
MKAKGKNKKRLGFITLETINHFSKAAFTSLISLVVIRNTGEEVWGSFVPFLIGVELALTLLNWGQKPYLLRSFSLESFSISKSWSISFWSRLILFLPILVLLGFMPYSAEIIGYCLAWTGMRFFTHSLEPVVQYSRTYLTSIVSEVLALIVAVGILLLSEEITLTVLFNAMVFSSLSKAVVLFIILPRGQLNMPKWFEIKSFLFSAFPFFLLGFVGLLQSKVDLYLVSWLMPKVQIAFYQVLIGFLIILQTSAFVIIGPFQKNIYRMSSESLRQVKQQFLWLGIIIVTFGSVISVILLKWLYLFDVDFFIAPLIVFYVLPSFWYMLESQVLIKHKELYYLSFSAVLSTLLGAIIIYFTIQSYGVMGALIGGITSRLIFTVLISYKYERVISRPQSTVDKHG